MESVIAEPYKISMMGAESSAVDLLKMYKFMNTVAVSSFQK